MKRKRKRTKKEPEKEKTGLKEKMAEALELPKEIVLDVPKITMVGRKNLILENYKGIIEYDSKIIRINTSLGIVKIIGANMVISEITSEDIIVNGKIISMEILE